MKQILLAFILFFTMIGTLTTQAFEMKAGEDLSINEVVNDDLYIAGGRVSIDAPINGDLIIAGGELSINSDISEDAHVAGGDIVISGKIGDDLRIAGGNIRIESDIHGDLVVGAGDVKISKGVVISGDLIAGAGRVIIDGDILGNVKIGSEELILNGNIGGDASIMIDSFKNPSNTGAIEGNLNYESHDQLGNLELLTKGEVLFTKSYVKEEVKEGIFEFVSSYLIIKVIGLFLFASLIYLYFEKLFTSVSEKLRTQTGRSCLYSFLAIIGTPIIIILLFISVIGIPFAFFLLFAYIFMFVFLGFLNVMIFSGFFINKFKVTELYKKLFIILGFTLVFGLINGINIIVGFFTVGAFLIKKAEMIGEIRK